MTLKGFKSFASATTLRLEPGITCVVGPNGSGKSNLLEAITLIFVAISNNDKGINFLNFEGKKATYQVHTLYQLKKKDILYHPHS